MQINRIIYSFLQVLHSHMISPQFLPESPDLIKDCLTRDHLDEMNPRDFTDLPRRGFANVRYNALTFNHRMIPQSDTPSEWDPSFSHLLTHGSR